MEQMGEADHKACAEELTKFEPHELREVRIELKTSDSTSGLHMLIATLGELQIYSEQFLHEINSECIYIVIISWKVELVLVDA